MPIVPESGVSLSSGKSVMFELTPRQSYVRLRGLCSSSIDLEIRSHRKRRISPSGQWHHVGSARSNTDGISVKQIYHAFRLCMRLKQTFIYLVRFEWKSGGSTSDRSQAAYFFLGDCLNTLVTVIATLQNEASSFDTKTLNL